MSQAETEFTSSPKLGPQNAWLHLSNYQQLNMSEFLAPDIYLLESKSHGGKDLED